MTRVPGAAAAPLHPPLLLAMDEELRASLEGLIGMVELLLDTRLTAHQQGVLQLGRASADALLSAINNLLSVAKIDAGVFDLDPIPFSLRDSLGYTIGALALRARERNLKLVSHILGNVPDALIGDPGVLRQAIWNVIEDAARRPGGGVVLLRVEKAWDTAQTAQLEFSVTRHDTGPPPPRGPGNRRAGVRPPPGPSALLAITRRLIETMGGRWWVKAGRGQASVLFSVDFDLQRHPAPRLTPADAAAVRGLPVLVVDDHPAHRHLLKETVARWGMRPVAVESGVAALRALARAARVRTPFKLVLLDATMPGMGGFELAARIRRAPACPAVPLMILALAGRRGDAARCRRLGVAAYLSRPVTRADLFDAILTVLGMPADRPMPFLVTRHSLRESARPFRILLLDGSPRDQALIVRVLEEDGHTVLMARTRAEALAAFAQQPIDVLCAEPRWSGLGLERLLALARERTRGEPPALLTIAPRRSPAARRRARQAGVQACLGRPLRPAQLRRAIQGVRAAAERPARPPRADVP